MTATLSKARLYVTAMGTSAPSRSSPALAAAPDPAILVEVMDAMGEAVSDLKSSSFGIHSARTIGRAEAAAVAVPIRGLSELVPGVYALYLDEDSGHPRDAWGLIVDVRESNATGRALVAIPHR